MKIPPTRAYLHRGQTAEARAAAVQVPVDWEYVANVYGNNSSLEENDIFNMLSDSQSYTVAPDYRVLTIDDTGEEDPRVEVFRDPVDPFAIDGSTPLFQAAKYNSDLAPVRFASGDEAQYIIAEIEAAEGDRQEAVRIINEIRARHEIDMDWTSADRDEILRKVLDEKGRTLFIEGQRMGDLRRYLDRYSIDEFPPSPAPPAEVGTCMPLPLSERDDNPGI